MKFMNICTYSYVWLYTHVHPRGRGWGEAILKLSFMRAYDINVYTLRKVVLNQYCYICRHDTVQYIFKVAVMIKLSLRK